MNLPEYRRAVRDAQAAFDAAIDEAAERLAKALMAADERFFEDENRPVGEEPVRRLRP